MNINISMSNLDRVEFAFHKLLDKNNILIDLEFPFFNVYDWCGEVLFSAGYRNQRLAQEFADASHFEPKIANACENNIKWIGIFDGSRTQISNIKHSF